MHHASILPRPVSARDWQPALPAGILRAVTLHWTAGDYQTVYSAYHFCLSGAADVTVHTTSDLRANMRDLRTDRAGGYAAHTQGRNSYAAGIAICAMQAATPCDFAAFPLTPGQVDALCLVAARLVRHYGVPLAQVRTHAEAALDDGYFGAAGADERWDIARLCGSPQPLVPAEAVAVGERLRRQIAELC